MTLLSISYTSPSSLCCLPSTTPPGYSWTASSSHVSGLLSRKSTTTRSLPVCLPVCLSVCLFYLFFNFNTAMFYLNKSPSISDQVTVEPWYSGNFRAFCRNQILHYMKISIYIKDNSHCSPLVSFKPHFRYVYISRCVYRRVSTVCINCIWIVACERNVHLVDCISSVLNTMIIIALLSNREYDQRLNTH